MVTPSSDGPPPEGKLGGGARQGPDAGGIRRDGFYHSRKATMRAAWWWIDRWRQSTAYTDMTAEEQGLYRNLLDEVWLRDDCVIPDDPRILARVSGDPEAWERSGAKVLGWMKQVPGGWTHLTALEVIAQSIRRADNQKRYRERNRNAHDNSPDNGSHNKPDSPSPSPSPYQSPSQEGRNVSPALPPADKAERAIRQSTDALRTRLYALVTEAVDADPKHRDPTELMRLFTSYEKGERQVGGVVNASLLTFERLEKSIADAEFHLAKWRQDEQAGSLSVQRQS